MTLHLASLDIEVKHLFDWARRAGVPTGDGDLGYVVHSALRATFGQLGPQPFALHGIDGRQPRVYGYGAADAAALRDHRAAFADPLLADAFPEAGIRAKPMPLDAFTSGRRLGFSVRLCPVQRQDGDNRNRSRETDAFLIQALARPDETLDREAIYRDWLAGQLTRGGAATLMEARLTAFGRIRISRRGADRRPHASEKPDATLEGLLKVEDGAAFGRLLARGVGRHRAFGFGMVLLKPPRSP